MGILDGIVEWIAEQVMAGLDLVTTSVLGALGCDMAVFLRYFPAAETMYSVFVALAIGIILLNWVWQLFKNFGLGAGVEAEDPVKLSIRSVIFILLTLFSDEIVNIVLTIGGTPYHWIMESDLPALSFADFNSVMLVIIGVCANGAVALITLILVLILAWNYLKLLFEAAERYVLLGVLVYTAPVAFSMGASQTTANIWKSWCRMLGGQIFLLVMNAWCLRLFTSMVGSFLANNEDFYYLNLLITITASNEEDLEWKVSEMKKLLLSQDMNACTCHFREEQAFLSALPLVAMEKKLYERGKRNLLTGGAASCYPFTSYEMCDDNGILLGVNKYNSSLIIVDIFNSAVYKNANMSILGTSGAGKTFTMQLMALRMRRKNIPIFIVAPLKGHEFHRACSNVGGSFIQISPASPHCINVMEIRRVDRSVNELLDGPGIQLSELAAKIQQLHIFFSLLIPDMSHEERQLLDEALVRTYNTKGITHDNASLEDPAQPGQYREMPVLGDLYEILKTSKETMRMAHILNRLVNGSASTFNKQTNVRLDNKYTVLDISSLTGDLLTVGMFVALDFVWDRAKADRTEEKAIFIDECWQLLSGAGAAGVRLAGDFLLEIAKTIRGYGGASIFASQDLADFFDLDGGRFGKGIINNSKTKIILNLEDDEAQRVQEALHLSDAETMEITHFERGHGLISTNNNNIMVEFKASPLEKDLITTDRRELREIVERKRREQSTSAEQQI